MNKDFLHVCLFLFQLGHRSCNENKSCNQEDLPVRAPDLLPENTPRDQDPHEIQARERQFTTEWMLTSFVGMNFYLLLFPLRSSTYRIS